MFATWTVLALLFGVVHRSSCFVKSVVDSNSHHGSLSTSKQKHVGIATDIEIFAVPDYSHPGLQLNISWKNPTVGEMPREYTLIVRPLITLEEDEIHCIRTMYETTVAPELPTLMAPPALTKVQNDFSIRHLCSYNVLIRSQPFRGEEEVTKNYTVPECVNELCSCRHRSKMPTTQNLSVRNKDPTTVIVLWSFNGSAVHEHKIKSFILKLGFETIISQKDKSLYMYNQTFNIPYVRNISTYSYSLTVNRTPVKSSVVIEVVDTRGCVGPAANITFISGELNSTMDSMTTNLVEEWSTEQPTDISLIYDSYSSGTNLTSETEDVKQNDQSGMVLLILVPSMLIVMMCVVVFVLWHSCGNIRRKWGDNNMRPIYSWSGVYKAVSVDSGSSRATGHFPALQERSVLYVEKEIEEAKARGEADFYEVSYDRLQLGRQIGKGAFGRVFLARAESIGGIPGFQTVAVKKLKQRASADEVEEFQAEIAMLKRAGRHPNVVAMLGCCTIRAPLCMLMEYVPCGDLLQYLRRLRLEFERRASIRPEGPRYIQLLRTEDSESSYIQPEESVSRSTSGRPSIAETEWSAASSAISHGPPPKLNYVLDPGELQSFAVQIARGMAHLEKRQITHRDLAARNILIDEHKTLKISDFGLSRSGIYVNTKRKKVPLRWLSVEAIRDNLYSSQSDVWAYAIVLWEIGTLGGFPYPTVADYDLLNFLLEGKRLEKPDNCTDELYALMLLCWSHSADDRPSFAIISKRLESVVSRRRVYVEFSRDYSFPPMELPKKPRS